MFTLLVKAFDTDCNLLLTDGEFIEYNRFIDNELKRGDIVKHDTYNFTGNKLADKINIILGVPKVVALKSDDVQITTRCKGQAVYFLVNNKICILTFSTNAITFFEK